MAPAFGFSWKVIQCSKHPSEFRRNMWSGILNLPTASYLHLKTVHSACMVLRKVAIIKM